MQHIVAVGFGWLLAITMFVAWQYGANDATAFAGTAAHVLGTTAKAVLDAIPAFFDAMK